MRALPSATLTSGAGAGTTSSSSLPHRVGQADQHRGELGLHRRQLFREPPRKLRREQLVTPLPGLRQRRHGDAPQELPLSPFDAKHMAALDM